MPPFSPLLLFVFFLILWAEFVNGWTDAPNAIATVVSTRVLSPRKAVILATALNIAGAFSGTAVAVTIGTGIVKADVINLHTLAAAMVGIIFWSTLAWKYGLPTSESHALISGLAGAGLAAAGPQALLSSGWIKVIDIFHVHRIWICLSLICGHCVDFSAYAHFPRAADVWKTPNFLRCVHGFWARQQRRTKVYWYICPRTPFGRSHPAIYRPLVGHPALCGRYGHRYLHRRLAHHQNHGHEPDQA